MDTRDLCLRDLADACDALEQRVRMLDTMRECLSVALTRIHQAARIIHRQHDALNLMMQAGRHAQSSQQSPLQPWHPPAESPDPPGADQMVPVTDIRWIFASRSRDHN